MPRLLLLTGMLALGACGVRPECAAPNPPCISLGAAQILAGGMQGQIYHPAPITYYPNLYLPSQPLQIEMVP